MTEAISVKAAAILIYFNSEFSSSELNFNSRDKFVQLLFLELNFLLALIRFKFKRTVNFCSLGSENWIEQHIAVLIRSKCIRYTHSFCHPLQLLKYIILFPSFWCGKLRGRPSASRGSLFSILFSKWFHSTCTLISMYVKTI